MNQQPQSPVRFIASQTNPPETPHKKTAAEVQANRSKTEQAIREFYLDRIKRRLF